MKKLLILSVACLVGFVTLGCEPKATNQKTTETTTTTPGGETTKTIDQKVETTPDSTTKTITEKVETDGNNPPPANP